MEISWFQVEGVCDDKPKQRQVPPGVYRIGVSYVENGRVYEGSFTDEDVKLSYSNEFTIKAKEVACSGLNEEECRNQSSCIPLGYAIRVYLETGGEEETFSFEECVDRVPEYKNCKEVVKMPQMYAGSKFPKECRCCCGERPFLKRNHIQKNRNF